MAATLLILRATELLAPGRNQDRATQLALGLYVAYNVAATVASVPAGRLGDRRGAVLVLVLGVALFGLAYAGFAAGPTSVLALAPWFIAAGVAIGCVETAEHAAVAALAPVELRGSAFGLLAAVQSFGNLAASAIAGLLWTAVSPRAAFIYLVAWMLLALLGLLAVRSSRGFDPKAAPSTLTPRATRRSPGATARSTLCRPAGTSSRTPSPGRSHVACSPPPPGQPSAAHLALTQR